MDDLDGRGAFLIKAADSSRIIDDLSPERIPEKMSVREKVRQMQQLIEKNRQSHGIPGNTTQRKMVIKDSWTKQELGDSNSNLPQSPVFGVCVENVRKSFQFSDESLVNCTKPSLSKPIQQHRPTNISQIPMTHCLTEEKDVPGLDDIPQESTPSQSGDIQEFPRVKDIISIYSKETKDNDALTHGPVVGARTDDACERPPVESVQNIGTSCPNNILNPYGEEDLRMAISQMYSAHTSKTKSELEKIALGEAPTSGLISKQNGLTLCDARQILDIGKSSGIPKETEDALQEEIYLLTDTVRESGFSFDFHDRNNDNGKGGFDKPEEDTDETNAISKIRGEKLDSNHNGVVATEQENQETSLQKETLKAEHSDTRAVDNINRGGPDPDILCQIRDDSDDLMAMDSTLDDNMIKTAIWLPHSLNGKDDSDEGENGLNKSWLPVETSTTKFTLAQNSQLGNKQEKLIGNIILSNNQEENEATTDTTSDTEDDLSTETPFAAYKTQKSPQETKIYEPEDRNSSKDATPTTDIPVTSTPKTIFCEKIIQNTCQIIEKTRHNQQDLEEAACDVSGTFIVNTDVEPEMFSRIKSSDFQTCKENDGHLEKFGRSMLIRKVSEEEVISDGNNTLAGEEQVGCDEDVDEEEDEDLENLHQRMGEILKWSDSEQLSSDSEYETSAEVTSSQSDTGEEEDGEDTEGESMGQLESALKMTLTQNVKEKISTMTEKDFSVMMSEYRQVLHDVVQQKDTSSNGNVVDDSETTSGSNSDSEDMLKTVKTYKPIQDVGHPLESPCTGHLNPSKSTNESATSIGEATMKSVTMGEGTLKPMTCHSRASCDASTSMGEATLKDVMLSFDSGIPCSSDNSTNTDHVSSNTSIGVNTTMSEGEDSEETDEGVKTETDLAEEETDDSLEDDSVFGSAKRPDTTKVIVKRLRKISVGVEASDRELVTKVLSPLALIKKTDQWEEVLADHLNNTDAFRLLQIEKNSQKKTDSPRNTETATDENGEVIKATSPLIPRTPAAALFTKNISAQVEQDMVHLKEDFMGQVKAKNGCEMKDEELMRILSEYRKNQARILERRLTEKRKANQKLQEKLLLRKKKAMDAASKAIVGSTNLEESIRKMDEDFYGSLSQKFEQKSLTDNEVNVLITDHVASVENFRHRVKMEVARRRREAIGQWMNSKRREAESSVSDELRASEIVKQQMEEVNLVKKLRSQEKARLDEKLKAKLAVKKAQRDSSPNS